MTTLRPTALALLATAALALSACGKPADPAPADSATADSAAPAAPAAPTGPVSFASLTGDAVKGATVFNQCKACHAVVPGQNGIGPSLHAVVGRTSGAVPGYAYSEGNKAGHIIWTPETLFTYLELPSKTVPGTKMMFVLRDPQQRADVIAYLATLQ